MNFSREIQPDVSFVERKREDNPRFQILSRSRLLHRHLAVELANYSSIVRIGSPLHLPFFPFDFSERIEIDGIEEFFARNQSRAM